MVDSNRFIETYDFGYFARCHIYFICELSIAYRADVHGTFIWGRGTREHYAKISDALRGLFLACFGLDCVFVCSRHHVRVKVVLTWAFAHVIWPSSALMTSRFRLIWRNSPEALEEYYIGVNNNFYYYRFIRRCWHIWNHIEPTKTQYWKCWVWLL